MKTFFLNISIKNKLMIGFGIIVLIMFTTGIREVLVLENLNEKRINTSDALRITELLREIKFTINSEFSVLDEINKAKLQKDLDNATDKHINNSNNIISSNEEIIRRIKPQKDFKFNIQNRQIRDSIIDVSKSYKKDIVPMFNEILKNKDNIINIENHYIESLQIKTYDSIYSLQTKQNLIAGLEDGINNLEFRIKDTGAKLISKLQNSEQLSNEITNNLKDETSEIFQYKSNETFIFMFSVMIISVLISLLISKSIISPIVELHEYLNILTKGELPSNFNVRTDDEIGEMGIAINKLIDGLKKTAVFSADIGKSNFVSDYKPLSSNDVLGNSLLSMRDSLKSAIEEEKKRKIEDAQRNRTTEGLALFGNILRRHTENINKLSDDIISNLVKFMNANQGGIFILNDLDKNNIYLDLLGSYAYNRKKYIKKQIRIGEGLVGAVAVEKYTVYMTDVPDEYIEIESGIGSANPTSVLIVPIKGDKDVLGVIELASFNELEKYEISLVEKIADSISSTLATAKINTRTAQLLEKAKVQTRRMKEQEEELLQNIEELKATKEEDEKKEKILQKTLFKLKKTSKILQDKDVKQKQEIEKLVKLTNEQIIEIRRRSKLSDTILETSINAIIILNKNFEIEIFNNSATRHFGYTKEEAIGEKIFFMMPEVIKKKIEKNNSYIETDLITTGKEGVILDRNKSEIPVYYSMTKFDFSGEEKFSVFFKNISREKKYEIQRMNIVEKMMANEFEYETKIEKLENILKQNNIKITSDINKSELIVWSDEYSINVNIIDQQHKRWINIINKLYNKFRSGKALEDLMQIFNELSDYTDYHFGFEEKYMSEFKYAEFKEHKKKHKLFLEQLNNFKHEYSDGRIDVAYRLMATLRKWVKIHILEDDKMYSNLFIKNGLT